MRRHLLAAAILFAVHSARAADEPTLPTLRVEATQPSRIDNRVTVDNPQAQNRTLGNLLEPALLVRWRDWKRAMLVEFPDEADDPRLYAARCVADGYWATAYGRPLDALEHANALAMAEQALKLCDPL